MGVLDEAEGFVALVQQRVVLEHEEALFFEHDLHERVGVDERVVHLSEQAVGVYFVG